MISPDNLARSVSQNLLSTHLSSFTRKIGNETNTFNTNTLFYNLSMKLFLLYFSIGVAASFLPCSEAAGDAKVPKCFSQGKLWRTGGQAGQAGQAGEAGLGLL